MHSLGATRCHNWIVVYTFSQNIIWSAQWWLPEDILVKIRSIRETAVFHLWYSVCFVLFRITLLLLYPCLYSNDTIWYADHASWNMQTVLVCYICSEFLSDSCDIFVPFSSRSIHRQRDVHKISQGLYSLRRRRLISIGIPITNLIRSSDRVRFIIGIPIPIRRRLLGE